MESSRLEVERPKVSKAVNHQKWLKQENLEEIGLGQFWCPWNEEYGVNVKSVNKFLKMVEESVGGGSHYDSSFKT